MSTVGLEAISRPTSTFCTLPPESRRTGVDTPGVTISSSSMSRRASSLGGLRSTKGPFPWT